MIEVILLERIERLGGMGDVVRVRPGFARNFLLPQKKALRATKANLAVFEAQRAALETANAAKRSEAEKMAGRLDGKSVMVIRQASDVGQLFGSVTARDIAGSVASDLNLAIDRSMISIASPIKALGLYPQKIRLHPEVSVTITVNVARSAEEATVQAQSGQAVVQQGDDTAEAMMADLPAQPEMPAPVMDVPTEAEATGKKSRAKKKSRRRDDEDDEE